MKSIPLYLVFFSAVLASCSDKASDQLVLVKGGTIKNIKSNFYQKNIEVDDFYISRFEVTQDEWTRAMGSNPSEFKGDSLPVETVSWYDCIEYCNKRSIKEGLTPYYVIDRNKKDTANNNEMDDVKWIVSINKNANGYRLPTEIEWEYAAGGGQKGQGLNYSGSNNIDDVAWYWQNSGDKPLAGNWSWPALQQNHNSTKPVGRKHANELGLYDMSGNVREWCWDEHRSTGAEDAAGRVWKGGGWIGADFCCEPSFRAYHQANGKGPDQGFRVCRNK